MFTNIVCAVDGSEHAVLALDYASQMARRDAAELHVAHVVEKIVAGRVAGQNVRVDEEQIDAKIQKQMNSLAAKYGIKPTLHMTAGQSGNAARQLAQIADEVAADLIVIGTRGHSAVAGVLLGSVTQRLLHIAHCPVLAVPPPHPAAESMGSVEPITTAS
jgi:nucleotide-binding universal stress UspA family protein